MSLGVIVLAAGQGTRMRSARPKVLHELCGRSMVGHVLEAARELQPRRVALVVGHGADAVRAAVEAGHRDLPLRFPVQVRQRGTGHAVREARGAFDTAEGGAGAEGTEHPIETVLVLYGDTPLLRAATLRALLDEHAGNEAVLTLLSMRVTDPTGYGRVVRASAAEGAPEGAVRAVIEESEASPDQQRIDEVNTGVMALRASWLWPALDRLRPSEGGEIYLTDLVAMAVDDDQGAAAAALADAREAMGVNDRAALARAAGLMRRRQAERLMRDGVTLIDPDATYVDVGVQVGPDTTIEPGTQLRGGTRVAEGCHLGPNTVLRDATIGAGSEVVQSLVQDATIGAGCHVGPFAHLRSGAILADGVHVGSYAEIKNSRLASGVRMGHVGYLGDAVVGEGSNIGAGTITCNYDGQEKHRTEIGRRAFVGSDTMLVAPVRLGDDARTGAGSVVTRDVPAGRTVVGVPARPLPGADKSAEGNGAEADRDPPAEKDTLASEETDDGTR